MTDRLEPTVSSMSDRVASLRERHAQWALSLAGQAAWLDPGERARLRRMQPEAPSPDALGLAVRLLVAADAAESELEPPRIWRWTLFLQALAILAQRNTAITSLRSRPKDVMQNSDVKPSLHDPKASLGHVLRDVLTGGEREPQESDTRLLTLLEAQDEIFDALLIRMMRDTSIADAARPKQLR
jgi:hypothetical protein